jgi:hypothetical protein
VVSEEKIFRNPSIINKNCLWWPCLLTNRDEMSILIEDFPYMPSTKFQFIWESGFKEDFFRNQPIRKKKKVLYTDCSFRHNSLANIAATGNSCFRLVDF